jgi:ribonuclease HI
MGRRSPLARACSPRPTRSPQGVHVHDQVKPVTGPIVVATDASVASELASCGYVATTGHSGVRAHLHPRRLTQSSTRVVAHELRAVYWGLNAVLTAAPGRPVEVRCDSLGALHFLAQWAQGGSDMPAGYDTELRSEGRPPTLLKLQMIAEYTPGLTFVHEKAHVGHPLNEAADSLAKLGLRCLRGIVPASEVSRLVPLWATNALDAYARSTRSSSRSAPSSP